MNFTFNINKILPEEITKLDSQLQVCRQFGSNSYGYKDLKKMLFEVVDKMGDASAKAQRLPSTITTGSKLENSNHHLYIMKDTSGEQSCVIGILKVGPKKLFVYDSMKVQHELEPLCILDFYVHESKQRMGCGRKMFDFMLRTENIQVQGLAIDRPSPKFLLFLKKHYCLQVQIPQVNNFVIFDGFFNHRNDSDKGQRRFNTSSYRDNTSGRSRPQSDIKVSTPSTPQHLQQQQNHGNYPTHFHSPSKYGNRQSPHYMAAGERLYSRHGATPPNPRATPGRDLAFDKAATSPRLDNNFANGSGDPLASSRLNLSPSIYHVFNNDDNSSWNNNSHQGNNEAGFGLNLNKMTPPHKGSNLSRYQNNNLNNNSAQAQRQEFIGDQFQSSDSSAQNFSSRRRDYQNLPSAVNGAFVKSANNTPISLPDIRSGGSSHQNDNPVHQNNSGHLRPPSGKRTKPSEPPMLQRDGPPAEYHNMLNLHQNYQGRQGRLALPTETKPLNGAIGNNLLGMKPPQRPSTYEQSYSSNNNNNDWNWGVSGYLREQRMKQSVSSRYNPGRLW